MVGLGELLSVFGAPLFEVYNWVFPRADVNYGGSCGYGRKYMYVFPIPQPFLGGTGLT